jgi:pseudouridine-5'-phosphate glycosidase
VSGRALTPFLLRRINELSKGDSLKSNIALVKNNAALGTAIAVALSRLERPKARL